jgi:hypothetical protein
VEGVGRRGKLLRRREAERWHGRRGEVGDGGAGGTGDQEQAARRGGWPACTGMAGAHLHGHGWGGLEVDGEDGEGGGR